MNKQNNGNTSLFDLSSNELSTPAFALWAAGEWLRSVPSVKGERGNVYPLRELLDFFAVGNCTQVKRLLWEIHDMMEDHPDMWEGRSEIWEAWGDVLSFNETCGDPCVSEEAAKTLVLFFIVPGEAFRAKHPRGYSMLREAREALYEEAAEHECGYCMQVVMDTIGATDW